MASSGTRGLCVRGPISVSCPESSVVPYCPGYVFKAILGPAAETARRALLVSGLLNTMLAKLKSCPVKQAFQKKNSGENTSNVT